MYIICDIDGTIANITHRLKFIEQKPKDWKSFHEACSEDVPIPEVIKLVQVLGENHNIYYVTGRPESSRGKTTDWLKEHLGHVDIPDEMLFMRPDGDFREDYILKQEILDMYFDKESVWFALDDRQQVVDMWRRNGIKCLQVAKGDY